MAPALRSVPADLMEIAVKNGDVFPSERIRQVIDGREVESHGDPEMPVWGDVFKTPCDGFSEISVTARVRALVAYIESIQRRLAH